MASTFATTLMGGPLALIFGVSELRLATELWLRPGGKVARRLSASYLPGDPAGKLHFFRLLTPILGITFTIAGLWMIGDKIHNGADWPNLIGPLEWHAVTFPMIVIYGCAVAAGIELWQKRTALRWPSVLGAVAFCISAAQMVAFQYGVQFDRWALLMLVFVAALIWLSSRVSPEPNLEPTTVQGD